MKLYSSVMKNEVTDDMFRSSTHWYIPLSLNVTGVNRMVMVITVMLVVISVDILVFDIMGILLSVSILTHVILGITDDTVVTVQMREKL